MLKRQQQQLENEEKCRAKAQAKKERDEKKQADRAAKAPTAAPKAKPAAAGGHAPAGQEKAVPWNILLLDLKDHPKRQDA